MKYPEVSFFSAMTFSKILFSQLSPTQFLHVGVLLSKKTNKQTQQKNVDTLLLNYHCKHYTFSDHPDMLMLFVYSHGTCDIVNVEVCSDKSGVGKHVSQFYPVAVTVKILKYRRQ